MTGNSDQTRPSGRLSKAARHRQLLDTAHRIVGEGRADRLTLGYLAAEAGVSKPVAYDHFGTRTGLLLELYKMIDLERMDGFRDGMRTVDRGPEETAARLAEAYIRCATDTTDAFHAVGAALAGNEEKASVFQELLGHGVKMFADVLAPHASLSPRELHRHCIALVGAGEALAAAVARKHCTTEEAIGTFTLLISGCVGQDRDDGFRTPNPKPPTHGT